MISDKLVFDGCQDWLSFFGGLTTYMIKTHRQVYALLELFSFFLICRNVKWSNK